MAKEVKTRIQHKHDTIENWGKAVNFKPLPGELIIYDDYVPPRVKIGNGEDYVADLMFIDEMLATLDSPVFTGVPTVPTADVDSSDNTIASTAFVQAAITKALESLTPKIDAGTNTLIFPDTASVEGTTLVL